MEQAHRFVRDAITWSPIVMIVSVTAFVAIEHVYRNWRITTVNLNNPLTWVLVVYGLAGGHQLTSTRDMLVGGYPRSSWPGDRTAPAV